MKRLIAPAMPAIKNEARTNEAIGLSLIASFEVQCNILIFLMIRIKRKS